MVRSAHCGRHKIGFAVQWMVIAWFFLWLPCSSDGARMVSSWTGCTLFDCFFLVFGWSSWQACAHNGAGMVSLRAGFTFLDCSFLIFGQVFLVFLAVSSKQSCPSLMVLVAPLVFPMRPSHGVAADSAKETNLITSNLKVNRN